MLRLTRFILTSVCLALILIGAGCSAPAYTPVQTISGDLEYGFLFKETTGITYWVLHQGKEVAIKFRSDSDPDAVRTLDSQEASILYNKADGKQMFLIGKLHSGILHTPHGRGRAQSEPYQEFSLRGWRVKD